MPNPKSLKAFIIANGRVSGAGDYTENGENIIMQRERIECDAIQVFEYSNPLELPTLTDEQRLDVFDQLKTRYLTNTPSFEPTTQERRWGIQQIPPENTYWEHFRNRIPTMINILQKDKKSNKAVITIDYPNDPPCYQSFHFKFKNDNVFELTCFARSLDLKEGLPRDAHLFWYAALVPVSMTLNINQTKLIIVSNGAHTYKD